MDITNYEQFINKLLENEQLMPGDKVNYKRLTEISKKYGISEYILATNVFGVSQTAFNGLKSNASNAKNIIILKSKIPLMIETAIQMRETILQQEHLNSGNKINYVRLQEISKKYQIRENILALYVFEISEYSFRQLKYDSNANAIILNNNKQPKTDKNISDIRNKILTDSTLKAGDKINYQYLLELSKRYCIPEKKLALDVFAMSNSSYNHIRYNSKRNATILPNYFSQEDLLKIKEEIIEKEKLMPYDEINYDILLQISKRYNINERILALDILNLTQSQYYNIKYNPSTMASILKSDYKKKSPQELKKIKQAIFENELLKEGYRISLLEIEKIQHKYNLSLQETLYILGVTKYSYNFIKSNSYYKSIVKDTEVLLISQILTETMEKEKYYSKKEIVQICQDNGISFQNFLDYILGKAIYFGYEQYKELLDEKGKIWYGDRNSLSEEFIKSQISTIQHIAEMVSRYICNHYKSNQTKLEKEDISQDASLYIITQCGDLEKNFEGDSLTRMIYLRTRMNMLKQISMNCKVRTYSTTKYFQKAKDRNFKGNNKDVDLDLADANSNTEQQALQNISDEKFTYSSILQYLSYLLEQGCGRDDALNKTSQHFGIDKLTMLKAMKQELLDRGKVKKRKNGDFVLGD